MKHLFEYCKTVFIIWGPWIAITWSVWTKGTFLAHIPWQFTCMLLSQKHCCEMLQYSYLQGYDTYTVWCCWFIGRTSETKWSFGERLFWMIQLDQKSVLYKSAIKNNFNLIIHSLSNAYFLLEDFWVKSQF